MTYALEVEWEGGLTAVYQVADNSHTEPEFTGSADLFALIPRSNGEWLIYVEASSTASFDGVSAFYPTVNGDARSVLTNDGKGGIQISELNYTFIPDDKRRFTLGLVDPSAWLDRGRIANDENKHFLNGSFVNNATIEFPDYTIGAIFRWLAKDSRPEFTVVITGSDGIADLPDRSYQSLLDVTSDSRGAFIGAGASWILDRASWRLGAWVKTNDHPVAGSVDETEMNYGVYGVYGWQSGSNALNFRAGLANPDVSISDRFIAVAYERKSKYGLLGIGVAKTHITDGYQVSDKSSAVDSEFFFRIPILQNTSHITPSVQYVVNPGFDISGELNSSSAVVAGVRFHLSF